LPRLSFSSAYRVVTVPLARPHSVIILQAKLTRRQTLAPVHCFRIGGVM
jgi:hypothetical protein